MRLFKAKAFLYIHRISSVSISSSVHSTSNGRRASAALDMNIDFATFYLVSVPGFLLGLMTGRFLAGDRWQSIKLALGPAGRLLSAVGMLAAFSASLVTLGVMAVYLVNLPAADSSTKFWVTLLVGLWMLIGLFLEIRDLRTRQKSR
jgi:hypothetical protein